MSLQNGSKGDHEKLVRVVSLTGLVVVAQARRQIVAPDECRKCREALELRLADIRTLGWRGRLALTPAVVAVVLGVLKALDMLTSK